MIVKEINNFNLEQISKSGQCFRMDYLENNKYSIVMLQNYLELEQQDNQFIFYCSQEEFYNIWFPYFDLEVNYKNYIDSVDITDPFLSIAITYGNGIRILRQDLWEVIVTFIISQNNNIARIKKNVELLCYYFGNKKTHSNGKTYYTFPSVQQLANLSLEDLKDLALGYRDSYILQIAKDIYSGTLDLSQLKLDCYETAYEKLMKCKGIGKKVANCICLFGLHKIDAFPIDTHIKHILDYYYKDGFPLNQYKGYAGVIQQYMFYYHINYSPLKKERFFSSKS